MNDKEILRLSAIRDVCEKRIRRADAASILSLSIRQIQRLVTRFRQLGAAGIVHQHRGKPSPNKIHEDIRCQCLSIIREIYPDDCLGELIQIDGSHHDWFEERSPKCSCWSISMMPPVA